MSTWARWSCNRAAHVATSNNLAVRVVEGRTILDYAGALPPSQILDVSGGVAVVFVPPTVNFSKPGTLKFTAEGARLSAGDRPVGPRARGRATNTSAPLPSAKGKGKGKRARSSSVPPPSKRAKHASEAVTFVGSRRVYTDRTPTHFPKVWCVHALPHTKGNHAVQFILH